MELAVGSEAKEETEETAEKRETNRTEFAGWEVPSRSLTKSPSFGRLDGNPKLPRASAAGGRLSVGSLALHSLHGLPNPLILGDARVLLRRDEPVPAEHNGGRPRLPPPGDVGCARPVGVVHRVRV